MSVRQTSTHRNSRGCGDDLGSRGRQKQGGEGEKDGLGGRKMSFRCKMNYQVSFVESTLVSQIKTGDLGKNEFDTKSLILCEGGEWLRVSGQLDWQEGNNVDICTRSHRIRPTIAHTREPSYKASRGQNSLKLWIT